MPIPENELPMEFFMKLEFMLENNPPTVLAFAEIDIDMPLTPLN